SRYTLFFEGIAFSRRGVAAAGTAAITERSAARLHHPAVLEAQTLDIAAPPAQAGEVIRPLDTPAFLRLFQLRASQIMWFLGAGASRAAGIKTAGDMIWDFKQRLYRSQKKLPPSAITDIGE